MGRDDMRSFEISMFSRDWFGRTQGATCYFIWSIDFIPLSYLIFLILVWWSVNHRVHRREDSYIDTTPKQ